MVTMLDRPLDDKYYDDGDLIGQDEIPVILPNPNRGERREIKLFKSIYRGVMYVGGGARQGKDLFGVTLSYLFKRYFGRSILLDFKPRRLFGHYTYFNPQLMMSEISKMAKLSEVDLGKPLGSKEQEQRFTEASNEWVDKNTLLFKNSVVYFSELRRYCHNRNPHNRVNKFVGALATQWGHLDMLIIGTHLQQDEIDYKSYLEKTKIWVSCKWMATRLHTTRAMITRDMYLNGEEVLVHSPRDIPYTVDGGASREFLTHTETRFTLTPEGAKRTGDVEILSYLKGKRLVAAKDIAIGLGAGLDETLKTLWVLSTMGCVVGNRLFDLWNSKNMVNLQPTIKGEL